jgi:hypothetical protein
MCASHDIAMGWPEAGDLSTIVDDAGRLRAAVHKVHASRAEYQGQTDQERSVNYICVQARLFVRGVEVGDIVAAADGERVLGVCQVGGGYRFDPDIDPNAPHRRRVEWLNVNDWVAPNPPGKKRPQGFRTTCWLTTDPGTIATIRERLPREGRDETS